MNEFPLEMTFPQLPRQIVSRSRQGIEYSRNLRLWWTKSWLQGVAVVEDLLTISARKGEGGEEPDTLASTEKTGVDTCRQIAPRTRATRG